MAIKVGGTTVIDDSRNVDNIGTIKGLTYPSSDGTAGQFLKTDGAGTLAFQTVESDPTKATLTKTFASGESASLTLSTAITSAPVVGVIKEVPQTGVSSKGAWDVNATASNYELHNTAYSTTLTPSTLGYGDLSNTTYSNNSFIDGAFYNFSDFYVKNDGTKMWAINNEGALNEIIRQYSLSTPYDISTASYDNKSFNVYSIESDCRGLTFKPDGTAAYIVGRGSDMIIQLDLSTAWDISTASYNGYAKYIGSYNDTPHSVRFKPDGTKVYILNYNDDTVYEWHLSTAWDLSSIGSVYQSYFGTAGVVDNPMSFDFNTDGTKVYIVGDNLGSVRVYSLSTAWDVSTYGRLAAEDYTFSPATSNVRGLHFAGNGTKMYSFDYGGSSQYAFREFDVESTGNILTLGIGSFSASDVGKNITGNGGNVTLTSAAGAYDSTGGSDFTDSSTIASGSWTMSGIKSAGADDGLAVANLALTYDVANASLTGSTLANSSIYVGSQDSQGQSFHVKPDGTAVYFIGTSQDRVYKYNLSTAWDFTTASVSGATFYVGSQETGPNALFFKPDGTKMYVAGEVQDAIIEYDLGTAWDHSTASHTRTQPIPGNGPAWNNPFGIFFKPDGTKMYVVDEGSDDIQEFNLSTAWDVSTISWYQTFDLQANSGIPSNPAGIWFKEDGTGLFVLGWDYTNVYSYTLSTAWDISTASSNGSVFTFGPTQSNAREIAFDPDGTRMFILDSNNERIGSYNVGSTITASGAYHIAVTNSGGQIDSQYWTDINTMTADESANSGTVHYAVSTDDRTTWSVIDNTNGVRPIVRNNSGTWQYNTNSTYGSTTWTNASTNDEFYALQESLQEGPVTVTQNDVSNWTAVASAFVSSQTTDPRGVRISNDGTKLHVLGNNNNRIHQYTLSTPYNVQTLTHDTDFNFSSQSSNTLDLAFSGDGSKMFICSYSPTQGAIYQYSLTTPFDVSTASYDNVSFAGTAQSLYVIHGIEFSYDGTNLYVLDANIVYQYNLSTAYDLSTISYSSSSFSLGGTTNDGTSIMFLPDGSKFYIADNQNNQIDQFSCSTPWDISTASYDSITLNVGSQDGEPEGIAFSQDLSKAYMVGASGDRVYEFSTGMNAGSLNRMDKTQLDAVTDPNHYTLGDTLDLMIALRVNSQTSNVPTSDGVTINYDAEILSQGAVLGTDYDYDFPDSTTVRITSNAAQNLKIRVV